MTDADLIANPPADLKDAFPLEPAGELLRRCRKQDHGFTNAGWCWRNWDTLRAVLNDVATTPYEPSAYQALEGVYTELRKTTGPIDSGAACQMIAPILQKLYREVTG